MADTLWNVFSNKTKLRVSKNQCIWYGLSSLSLNVSQYLAHFNFTTF